MRRQRLIIFALMENEQPSSSSSDLSTTSSEDANLSSSSIDDEENAMFFPLLQYLMAGNRRRRIEEYVHIIDSWSNLEFKENMRLSRHIAELLIDELDHSDFLPQNNFGRSPIPARLSFYIFLWFLSNTEPLRTLSDRFNVSVSSVFRVVRRVAAWLLTKLDTAIIWPQGHNIPIVSNGFYMQRNIPSILGAIDSTHIRIQRPAINEGDYYNRKKHHSIHLQAIVDSRMRFTNVYCGEPGSLHDARVFRRSPIYATALNEPEMLFPMDTFLLGDSAYPSLPWLVPPFRDNGHLSVQQREFNFLHSSTRMAVERAFGNLKGRFRRIKFFNEYRHISFIVDVVVAACILHNYCMDADEESDFDDEDDQLDLDDNLQGMNQQRNDQRDRRMEIFRELFPEA